MPDFVFLSPLHPGPVINAWLESGLEYMLLKLSFVEMPGYSQEWI